MEIVPLMSWNSCLIGSLQGFWAGGWAIMSYLGVQRKESHGVYSVDV